MSLDLTKTKRYQALDLWRGLICLFVVLEHAVVALWQESEGSLIRRILVAPFQTNLGTPLFFVISGYCIASSLASCQRRGTSPILFLARRFWRVFPPYWVALIGFALVVSVLDYANLSPIRQSPYALELPAVNDLDTAQWVGNLTLTETWRPRVLGGEANIFTRIAWSLCYQEQFYVVCFAALLFARKNLFRMLGILTIGIVGLRIALADFGSLHRIDGTFPVLWHQFAIGLGAFHVLNGHPSVLVRRSILLSMVGVAVSGMFSENSSTTVSAVFGLMMVGLYRWDASWAKIQMLSPLRALGRRSYSIYLVHLPVLVLVAGGFGHFGLTEFWTRAAVTVPISIVLSVGFGLLFYRLVESRFLEIPSYATSNAQVSQACSLAETSSAPTAAMA